MNNSTMDFLGGGHIARKGVMYGAETVMRTMLDIVTVLMHCASPNIYCLLGDAH